MGKSLRALNISAPDDSRWLMAASAAPTGYPGCTPGYGNDT